MSKQENGKQIKSAKKFLPCMMIEHPKHALEVVIGLLVGVDTTTS